MKFYFAVCGLILVLSPNTALAQETGLWDLFPKNAAFWIPVLIITLISLIYKRSKKKK